MTRRLRLFFSAAFVAVRKFWTLESWDRPLLLTSPSILLAGERDSKWALCPRRSPRSKSLPRQTFVANDR